MRIGLVLGLLAWLALSGQVLAQTNPCSVCKKAETSLLIQGSNVCLSSEDLAGQIATHKPIGPPGLNEPHMNIHGTVVACLCFERMGKVKEIGVVSGPAMMQQSILESVKDWTFRPVERGGRLYGACGPLRIRVDVVDSRVKSAIEK